ncbi:hypothetical protein SODALDRAFT_354521 [Sodiomyces alkalinus F11]|uniref:Uncharacterized protein n=1 Tax=Sodiomyces alkalinus (strain CBS 110278 / VKM F-3762 / F11) TaxID=1314773 RepID=A0A3N2Q6L4_SODAK|nr:hypothetical protein SODALDRAFT_354521 [Sodiomyces alkalinus F11]ROT42380.1 hypothetical protein SODALDRAFT_354521 [Sodiomyces alkalinus F11]
MDVSETGGGVCGDVGEQRSSIYAAPSWRVTILSPHTPHLHHNAGGEAGGGGVSEDLQENPSEGYLSPESHVVYPYLSMITNEEKRPKLNNQGSFIDGHRACGQWRRTIEGDTRHPLTLDSDHHHKRKFRLPELGDLGGQLEGRQVAGLKIQPCTTVNRKQQVIVRLVASAIDSLLGIVQMLALTAAGHFARDKTDISDTPLSLYPICFNMDCPSFAHCVPLPHDLTMFRSMTTLLAA